MRWLALLAFPVLLAAQPTPPLALVSQAGPLANIPPACTLGQLYFATDQTAGQNVYGCTTAGNPGVWTLQAGGSSGSGGKNKCKKHKIRRDRNNSGKRI